MTAMLGALPAACAGTSFSFFEPIQPPRPIQVMAHRGQASQAPENTRAALAHCIEDGLAWAEVDVRRTQDGRHLLSHDAVVTDSAGKTWTLREVRLEALQPVDVGTRFAARFAGERLISLSDCLAFCKGRLNLYLDCKAIDPESLTREILAAGMERQVIVYAPLDEVRKVQSNSQNRVATMAKWRPGLPVPDWAVTNGLAAVEIDAPDLAPAVCAAFQQAGVLVQVKALDLWDRPEFWDRAMAAGANWVQTDLPEEVLAHALWRRLGRRPVLISLHRGASRYAPENTLPAFAKAVRLGADFVEFDVRAARDGTLFLLHDGRLDRTTDGKGPLNEATADAVGRLSAGVKFGLPYAAVRVPTLDEFLDAFGDKVGLYFDAKAIAPEALAAVLERRHLIERTVVYQSPAYLERLKAINGRIRLLAPLGQAQDLDALVARLQPYAVDADWTILSQDLIARCHTKGVRVFSDALGDHERLEDYRQAMAWGIDLIQTDHPLRVLRAIELSVGAKPAATP